MFLFNLDASIRVEGSRSRSRSRSRSLADVAEQQWRDAYPYEPMAHRYVVVDPILATAWATAVFATSTPKERARRSSTLHRHSGPTSLTRPAHEQDATLDTCLSACLE